MSLQILNEELQARILQIAREERHLPTDVVDEALHLYLERRGPNGVVNTTPPVYDEQPRKMSGVKFLLSIAGQRESNETDVSERDEEILAAEVDPIRGLRLQRADENS